jgi:hypothetical protein
LRGRAPWRRAVEAAIFVVPVISFDSMLEAMLRDAQGRANPIVNRSQPADSTTAGLARAVAARLVAGLALVLIVGGSVVAAQTRSKASPDAADPKAAPWAPTVQCPSGREYRDLRKDAGRDESCALTLPGALVTRDGPARSWYSRDHLNEEGRYQNGRKVGRWRECDRFDRCTDHDYAVVESYERNHEVKPELPVSYFGRKYTIDFASCWSTSISRKADGATLDMAINGGMVRCEVSYATSIEGGKSADGQGGVDCEIPYALGTRRFDSLDLKREFAKAGLPPFCGQTTPTDDPRSDPPEQAFAIWANQPILGASARREGLMWVLLANMPDVECASIQKQPSGLEQLTVRLNQYADQLVVDRLGRDEVKADACNSGFPLTPMKALTGLNNTRDRFGRTLFAYALGPEPLSAQQQRKCIESQIDLRASCGADAPGGTAP